MSTSAFTPDQPINEPAGDEPPVGLFMMSVTALNHHSTTNCLFDYYLPTFSSTALIHYLYLMY